MAIYEYLALSKNGKKIKRIIKADSKEEARTLLQCKNITLLKISNIKERQIILSKEELLDFMVQLKNLLSAGVVLYDALVILADKNEKKKIKLLILDLSERIKKGQTLSHAMKSNSGSFDIIMCSMVENAQTTGRLTACLQEIVKLLTGSIKLKKKLLKAFTYPAILSGFCFLVLNFLLFFTIPTLFDLFEGRRLHPITKIVFSISQFVNNNKIFLTSFFIIFSFLIFVIFFYKPIKDKMIKNIYRLPFIQPFMIKVSLIRFCISFSNLLKGGQAYEEALGLSINVLKHPLLEGHLLLIKEQLMEGKLLSELMKKSEHIPYMMSKMLSIAEETSEMPEMLINIAAIYEDEVDKALSKISTVVQPVLLIILGFIIGFVVLSILIPLTDVSSFIGE